MQGRGNSSDSKVFAMQAEEPKYNHVETMWGTHTHGMHAKNPHTQGMHMKKPHMQGMHVKKPHVQGMHVKKSNLQGMHA